ncbi:unnamed protein product [Rotaria sp. Silwood1]|nr:unnamed protein product [Rotaria sp. Silwood1]
MPNYNLFDQRRCRCLSSNSTRWPNSSVWQTFNQSIDGRLVSPLPSAAVCHSTPVKFDACNTAITNWSNSSWRSDQVGAMQSRNWENSLCSVFIWNSSCIQGAVPTLAVNATLPEHVEATVQIASTYNLRLVIKTTGHDYLGRSTANGSFLLWLHYMKNMTLIDQFTACGDTVSNAIRLSAGVQWGEAYAWLNQFNLTAVGGAYSTVSAAGGYLQGGGHSPLSRWKGLAADNVLEFDVVTADGRRETVNACHNPDLFWALRGGGGGTFAIVLNVVLRTYPSPPVIAVILDMIPPNDRRYDNFVSDFVHFLPTLADRNWSGYFSFLDSNIVIVFMLPNGDANVANATFHELLQNYIDFNFTLKLLFSMPSFNVFFNSVLAPSNATGANILLGSRLIPERIVRHEPHKVARTFIHVRKRRKNKASLLGHLIAGGQVSNMNNNNSVNPVWRTALIHMVYVVGWPDLTSKEKQQALAKHLTRQVEILQRVAGGDRSGCYMNEADPNEPNWQHKFFGTQAIYDRLKSIKNSVDPLGLFICRNCVGSDDWSSDLNCPKT